MDDEGILNGRNIDNKYRMVYIHQKFYMALLHELETQGNWLFKRRGQMPVVLFILAVPAVFLADYAMIFPLKAKIFSWSGIALSIIGAMIRAYTIGTTPKGTSGRNTDKQVAEQLNSTGIYSIVRHPLYLGNFFMWIGIVVYTLNPGFVLIVCLLYWLYYERIMFAEERFLEKQFGKAYVDWSMKAPAFIPRFTGFVSPSVRFSVRSVLRREYSGWLAAVIGFVFVHLLREYTVRNQWENYYTPLIILGIALVATLILRTLKHQTKLLLEEDRS